MQLTEDLAEMLLAVTENANERVAPGTELLLATDREAVGVARPAARVITRHMPAGMGGAGNPDMADAVAAVITLFRYGLRQLRLYHQLRREQAAAAANGPDGPQEAEVIRPADPLHPVA